MLDGSPAVVAELGKCAHGRDDRGDVAVRPARRAAGLGQQVDVSVNHKCLRVIHQGRRLVGKAPKIACGEQWVGTALQGDVACLGSIEDRSCECLRRCHGRQRIDGRHDLHVRGRQHGCIGIL